MNGRAFKLGTFAKPDGKPFAAIVLDDTAVHLAQAHEAYRGSGRPALQHRGQQPGLHIQDLLDDWDKNFAVLQEIVGLPRQGGRRKPGAAAGREPDRAAAGRAARARCSTPRRTSRSTSTR